MAVDTSRIDPKKQSIKDAYEVPDNFLEIDISNPQTHGVGKKRYTDYEVRMRVGHSQNHVPCRCSQVVNVITVIYWHMQLLCQF